MKRREDTVLHWHISHRADPQARVMADRHYSRQKLGSPQFVPPGSCFVLHADGAYWVTSFPIAEFVKHEWAGAWMCSAFRRESHPEKSSVLIREAVAATRWYYGNPPELGMVTFVDAAKVKRKRDPGRCFLRAGFRRIGETKGGLLAFQLLPSEMPNPEMPNGVTQELFA